MTNIVDQGIIPTMNDQREKPMTEHQIERHVEREMDLLDRAYMNGDIELHQYETEVRALDRWAREQYRYAKKNFQFLN